MLYIRIIGEPLLSAEADAGHMMIDLVSTPLSLGRLDFTQVVDYIVRSNFALRSIIE